ncbi:MAG TPA: glycosyltransferase family 39 protein [Bryobacterales bacterium]|nr:glycosyltransferase family 39 protein [Bryobacterales bacterium]
MSRPTSRILICLAAADVLLHFAGSGRYGFFRDELYYIACGQHLAWGYVDQPPLIAVIARLSAFLLGNSLLAFRFFPALAGACLVLLTGRMTRDLGGDRFCQAIAGIGVLLAPVHLAFGSFFSMNAFEPLFWMGCACILLRILNGGDERLWLLFGAVAGVGLLNKHTTLLFGFALVAGLLLTRERERLRTKWFWLGGLLALAIFLPNLIWEAQHHWPQIEVVRNAQKFKNSPVGPLQFLGEQVLFLNPIALPVLAAGLAWLLLTPRGRRFRCLGWAFLIVLAVVMALKGKTYYPWPAYPMLIAAGGVALGAVLSGLRRKWLRLAYPALLAVSGIVMLPYGVPALPVQAFLRYQDALPLARSVKTERDSDGRMPQLYADMFGWEGMAATVARVYHSLPPAEQAHCAILAGNYGEAGAIDFFGPRYGLPKAISGHNNYYLWGPRGYTGEVVILFGERSELVKQMFGEVRQVATISDPYAVRVESNLSVYVCRRPKAPLAALWPQLKLYI